MGSVGGLCGIVHGVGNAMLMRGGACAAELRLMGLGLFLALRSGLCVMHVPFAFVVFFFVG